MDRYDFLVLVSVASVFGLSIAVIWLIVWWWRSACRATSRRVLVTQDRLSWLWLPANP